jgi:SAM-dependent methyltransferase
VDLHSFVLTHLPPSARVLEVGCGRGDLAFALAEAGRDVVAIDPEAPSGPLFRRVTLEAFEEPAPFDAVIAARSLHHVEDLAAAFEKIAELLVPEGLLVLDEFAKERFDLPTATWYFDRRRDLAEGGGHPAPASLDTCLGEWEADHAELHSYASMRACLDGHFRERFFAWVPYLFHELGDVAPEPLERKLIEQDTIRATGFRYVGETARE